ncbi:MAG: NAD-dependent succinate-semialdehyde dehydrogenase [Verrucomicrobiota bacterium]
MKTSDLLIHGERVPAAAGATYEIPSPASGEIIGKAASASVEDLNRAVASAKDAFVDWSKKTPWEREKIIRKATAHAKTKADEIGMLMALEQGKPLNQSVGEASSSCDMIDYYAAEGVRIEGEIHPPEKANFRSWVTYHPVGVCAAITPWNYPVALLAWKLGPALAAGCTVVVKPTPVTPLCATAFCAALTEGGIPPGVINVITGPNAALGEALVKHPDIAKIAMTGSTAVGKKILESAAPDLKKVSLELGGHCPAIVCEDADVDLAAKIVAYKGFRNCGQSCSTVSRAYVHRSVHDAFVEKLSAAAEGMTIGDGISDPAVDNGPMCTPEARAQVEAHVADAIVKGANLVYGGKRPEGDEFANGNYYLPTILTDTTPDMLTMNEETFGPVVPVVAFDDIDVAVAQANDTPWGLVSYLFANDTKTIFDVSERLEAGTVCVNHGAVNTPYAPYEGWGDSGYGLELSRKAIFEYLKTKHTKLAL